jgi:hypothetical protein
VYTCCVVTILSCEEWSCSDKVDKYDVVFVCGWPGQALAALNKQEEACQVWQAGYESALGLPEELPVVVQLHSLAMGNAATEPVSKPSAEVISMTAVLS